MKCTNESCGGEFPAGAKFCTGCGMEVQTTVPVKSTLCPSCNNIVLEGYKFCYICGEKINPALFINRVCSGTKDNGQKCNTVLNLGSRFCQSCGTPQDTSNTSSNVNLPGDAPLKLSLQISHQKEDNLERTIPVVQEEHVSSGSSSPDLWEVPTITLDSKDNKTESVKEILQQDDSQINLPKIEPSSTSKITSTHEQDVETIDTGQDCSSKLDNEVLEISDQQSDEAQESLQTVPVEMESPVLTDQQTVEPQKSSHTGPVDKEVPEVMDQRHVIGKPQGNDLTGSDRMEGIGQTDQQNGEPKCSEFSSPVDKEGQGRRDHQIDVPHGNQYADPEDKANQNLSDKKAVETQESILSDREKQAVKTETSTSEVENSIDDKEESADIAEETDASEKNPETNKPMQEEPELTNMETQSTDPQSDHSDNNGNQDTVKSNNITEIDDEKTQLKVEESKTDESCNQGQKEKDDIEDKENKKKVLQAGQKEQKNEVAIISEPESVDDREDENNERPSKRKAEDKGGQIKKIKGEKDNCNNAENTDEETKDKFGVQEEGDNKPSDTSSDQQLVESVNDEAFSGRSNGENNGIQDFGSSVDPPPDKSNSSITDEVDRTKKGKEVTTNTTDNTDADNNNRDVTESKTKEIPHSEDKPAGENENPKRITRSITKAMKEKENKAGNKEQESEKRNAKNGVDGRSVESQPNRGLGKSTNASSFDVFFHAIMHSSIYYNDDSCTAYVRFALDRLGGWKCKKHELFPVKKLANGNYEVGRLISIPRDCLSTTIAYSYFVVSGNTDMMEYIFHSNDNIRYVCVKPDDLKNTDGKLHRYDGVIRGQEVKDGVTNFFLRHTGMEAKQYRKELSEDARQSVNVFLPDWQTAKSSASGSGGEAMIMKIKLIHQSLQTNYCTIMQAMWERDLVQLFKDALTKSFEPLWQEFINKKEFGKEDKKKIMLNAIAVAYLFKEYQLSVSGDEGSSLCQALLPEYGDDGKQYEIEHLKEEMPLTFHLIPKVIVHLTEVVINCLNPSWLYCMPLLHILYNQSFPGEKPKSKESVKHDSHKPIWWGIADQDHYSFDLKKFKQKHIEEGYIKDIMDKLTPYFTMDYLLPRTLMSCIALEQLPLAAKSKWISPDIVLASLCFYVRDEKHITKHDLKEKATIDCLNAVLKKLNEENLEKSPEMLSCAFRSLMIAADVLKSMHQRYGNKLRDTVMCLALDDFLTSLHVYYTTNAELSEKSGNAAESESFEKTLDDVQSDVRLWLKTKMAYSKSNELLPCLKAWNRVLNVVVPQGFIKDEFVKFISECLHEALKYKRQYEEELVRVYCQNQDLFCSAMLDVLSKYVFEAVVRLNEDIKYEKWKEDQLRNFGQLLSLVFEKSAASDCIKDPSSSLQFILNWRPFPIYVKMCKNNIHSSFLSTTSVGMMNRLRHCIENLVKEIYDRSISLANLCIIQEKLERFTTIVKDIPEIEDKGLKREIELRIAELNAYNECLKNLKQFIDICYRCDGNITALEEQTRKFQELDKVSLKDISDKGQVPKDIKKYKPKVIAFEIESDVLEVLPEVIRCSSGNLFIRIWEKLATDFRRTVKRALEIGEIMDHVWHPAYREWKGLHQRLKTGEIYFKEFDTICGGMDPETLKKEFLILEDGKKQSWIKERAEQLTRYKNLQYCLDGASSIMEVVEEFELEGDFQPIRQIMQMTKGKDTKMNKLKQSYLKTCSVLSDINERKVNCLQKFMESKKLVNWLREKMSGLQELKTFVDLAYISTGDQGLEIAKVRCLQSAAIGYAPLIFNLETYCSYKDFLERCEEVWKALDSNQNLPSELLDTCHELEWLKIVDESQGSVEVTSLVQAEAINLNGTYHIGFHQTGDAIQQKGQNQLQLSDVLELRVTEKKEGKTLKREYNYEKLHDLQSRLMLVAGKAEMGKDDVDRFILILDSVVRLCNIYIKLLSSGCVLFSKFKVKFRCHPGSVACAFVSFGEGDVKRTIRGKTDAVNKDVSFFIPKIAKFLEQCHERWLEFIDLKREDYYILNYFSIEQMVILQQELVKIGFEGEPSNLIYPLLSNIKHECTRDDLIGAMKEAQDELEEMDIDEAEESEKEVPLKEEDNEAVKGRFIQQMMEAGYSASLAREALKTVAPDQIDEGIAWCIEHEEEDIEFETSATDGKSEQNQDKTFSGWSTGDDSLATVRTRLFETIGVGATQGLDTSVDVLIESLEKLWEHFVGSISSSVSDYLSVEHLALILRKVADKETMSVERSFAVCGCKEGIANLIVCSQSEMYNTVLTLYSTEDDSPLPLSDEVLLCTPNTSLDMLEIFWRRSLFGDSGKIYCLVNADLLDYEVSDKGEKLLEKHMKHAQNRAIQFKLVVVCSRENEYKSRLVAALDKYRRPQMSFGGEKHVKTYLSKRFVVDKPISGIETASYVDFDRSSVRVVKSWRAGVGKSLFKRNMVTALKENQLDVNVDEDNNAAVSIPLYDRTIIVDEVLEVLLEHTNPPHVRKPRIFHFDISHEVQEGVDAFLFQLLVLGCLSHSSGNVWRRSDMDYYIIESMPLLARDSDTQVGKLKCMHRCLDILPEVLCRSPKESLDIFEENFPDGFSETDLIFDETEYASEIFQRPYQYLSRLDGKKDLTGIDPEEPEGDRENCLQILLRHCGVQDPSWSELYHFVSFLNRQLQDFETSSFCSPLVLQDLPGFPSFVLKFLIQMSRDFATRSLQISEESPIDMLKRQLLDDEEDEEDIEELYEMRRKWESSPHPYLFFNPDHHTMTFLGFNIEKATGNLVDDQTGESLEDKIMEPTPEHRLDRQRTLFNGLNSQPGVNLSENFDKLSRAEKIEKLCQVMGIEFPHDPDDTYELTTDNVKKILAIYMRFRCDIPVIIMGETGCGKTRLIKFMCSLQLLPNEPVENMIIMKVHGGTTTKDIIKKVRKAEEIAMENAEDHPNMFTVLFFDEANTTEAIGVIKEIMCDKSLGGKPIHIHERLKIIAACNPYRKHKEELIKKLEKAGLGYHVDADKTTDRLGRVPMRRLVYRVQPLPQSMLPLVWDFGQLNASVEEMYIKQMVCRYVNNGRLPKMKDLADVTSRILSECQNFMRMQEDECSFVSLRDVERVLEVMTWFYRQTEEGGILYNEDAHQAEDFEKIEITRALILALGVCYQACLQKRQDFRDMIADYFEEPYQLLNEDQLETELIRCQDKFLDSVKLADNIARNQALKENVFMMIVCIELRIPLFLVGKPGSSKSLAKTIVADAMQGDTARSELFKKYKQVQMVSFQCSPLSTPDGILGTFRQCAEFQRRKDLDRFVSVVVLDEIGLAEDSPRMPLKTLHPLLEDGCCGDDYLENPVLKQVEDRPEEEELEDPIYKKVAFIGISNWALDPAKMNRGIFVQREVPDEVELIKSARGICRTSKDKERILKLIDNLIPSLSKAYSELFSELEKSKQREFFGLRDFYSLIKMVYAFAARTDHKPTWFQLKHAIMRNFGGLENINSVEIFRQCLKDSTVGMHDRKLEGDPDCSSGGMIKACLDGDSTLTGETRYLLLLTENYGDLAILQQKILMMHNAQVIFGSSFPSDQEYTQVCRNINRIKVCMETGSTVILLNLENLYESLYDALNQYYVHYGGERYVDLGLGSHRVKCKVHKEFRLIVVAEKELVYKKFPIPLINRLEKHVLSLSTMLSEAQLMLANKLEDWVIDFCHVETPVHLTQRDRKKERSIGEVFMGYHADTCAAIIMQLFEDKKCPYDDFEQSICQEILLDAKTTLLWCAAPDAVMRLKSTKLRDKKDEMMQIYFQHQHHDSLLQYLCHQVIDEKKANLFAQVTTHSKLLSTPDLEDLCQVLPIQRQNMTLLTLQSFDTEQQFCRQIRFSLEKSMTLDSLLIVQCDCGDQNADLIACARYSIQGELQQIIEKHSGNIHVVLIVQLPRVAGSNFTGFQCGLWHSLHIDDLRPPPDKMPSFVEMYHKPVSAFFDVYKDMTPPTEDMEMDAEKDEEPDMDVESSHEKLKRKEQIDILSLIMNCVHSALSMVKDPEKDSPRTTERIRMVLNLIQNSHEQEGNTFLSGIAVHLQCLLKEKEDQESELHKEWLSTEASNPDHINSAGTFRRAAIQCLEEKLASLLAGIIAFIDKNCNMNIVMSEQAHHWQKFVWLEILNCSQVTQLHYTHSPNLPHQMMAEHVVQGTAYEGGGFLAGMPFSWLIYRQIEEIMKTTFEEPGIHENHGMLKLVLKTASILESTSLGKILSQIEGTSIQEVIRCYIKDFVHMAYPVKSEPEQLNICENIMVGCRQIIQGEAGRLFPALVGCHAAFNHHRARFRNFSDIVHVWPECCEKVAKFQEQTDQEMMYLVTTDEITLDLMGLHLLLKNLEPASKETLNKPSSRKQWIRVLCDYRPVVERIFAFFRENEQGHDFSPRCTQAVLTARYLWTRATVLKLFIEHVCTEDSEVKRSRCMPLWVMLKTKADMKTLESLEKVEKFLKSCNKEVSSKIFGQQKCVHCDEPYTGAQETQPSPPVTLPCNHTICRRCFDETITSPDVKCPTCDQPFVKDFQPVAADQSENVLAYQDFRRRCNSFFMEIVSQLCFAEGTPPSNEIINKLLSYITVQTKKGQEVTKQLTIFNDCIDSTPVVRSFLLQHLMRTSGPDVHQHLDTYFRSAIRLVDPTTREQSHSVCHLVLQCMEDSYHQRYSEENRELIQAATEMLRNSCTKIQLNGDHLLENMEHLSQTRFSLSVAANLMFKTFIEKTVRSDTRLRRLFEAVGKLIEECGSSWPRRYFIKYLCRCYGTDCYQTIRTDCDMAMKRWINLPELQNDKKEECQDRFIVCGDGYTQMREAFVHAALNEDAKKIVNLLQTKKNKWKTEIRLLLVIYREFTMHFLYEEAQQQFSQKVKEFLQKTLMNCNKIQDKELIRDLLTNSVWSHDTERNISPALDLGQQGLCCLLMHGVILFKGIPGKQTWLSPLINMVNNPELMMKSYFPTMPQDDLDLITEALLANRPDDGSENPVFHRCPNGHLYVIGDCGRPTVVARCKAQNCGLEIGGQAHVLIAGNIKDQGVDTTDTGHILGRANYRNVVPFPERSLKPANCAIMKLLLHMAMYIGANNNAQAICRSIKPDIEEDDVPSYLLSHIQKDLRSISTILGRSVENVLVLTHFLLAEIMNSHTQARIGERAGDDICLLKDKRSRETWEDNFNKRYIAPVLEKSEEILNTVNNKIVNDKRIGSDPLLQLLYETDKKAEVLGSDYLSENPSVWQFRDRISVDHLMQTFTKSQQNCPVLQQFLDEEHFLRALRFVPGIIRLQKMLIQKYSRRLDRTEALGLTMDKVIMEFQDTRSSEILSCWNDFKQAWENVQQSLEGYGFPVNGNYVYLSKDNCRRRMEERTPIAYVLPSERDTGLCSYALLFFLLEKQNLFLQKYCQQSKTKHDSLPKVNVKDLSAAHLISYHPDRDLLPMVLANCTYSFEVGQGTKVEYNFTNLERQLMDRFLFTKSVILLKEIDTVVYRSETTNAVVFIQLRDGIKQERISASILSQIQTDLNQKTFPEVCDSIDKLDIAISFMKSVGCDPESPLSDFMINILKIDEALVSQKAQQCCKCKHIQCLWMTLALEKTKRLENNNKESFDNISSAFKQKPSEEQNDTLYEILDILQVEHLESLSQMIFDCILLTIDMPQKDEESVDMSKVGLKEAVESYLYDPPYANEALTPDWIQRFVTALPKDGESRLLCCHSVETWITINEIFTDKKDQML